MTKLRLQFLVFFILLQAGILFLFFNSYRQMNIEEKSLWEAESVKVYNQMQAQVSEMLNSEDARSFKDYRFFQSPENHQAKIKAVRSPLADLSEIGLPKGWLGYFQMDPDGSFSTPYLPASKDSAKSLPDYLQRKSKQDALEKSTSAFRKEMKGAFLDRFIAAEPQKPSVASPQPLPKRSIEADFQASTPNVYPNPISMKKKDQASGSLLGKGAKPGGGSSESYAPQLARREESADEGAVQTFAQVPAAAAPKAEKSFKEHELKKEPDLLGLAEAPLKQAPADKTKVVVKSKVKLVAPVSSAKAVVWLDPFQAKVSGDLLIFFRRVWLDQKMYLQGFVIQSQAFFDGLMQNTFENSDLPKFAQARWVLENEILATYGQAALEKQRLLFSSWLAYPLNTLQWEIVGAGWPQISTRLYMNILFGGILFFASLGLYWIYRSSATQVKLSQKRQDFVAAVTHELKTPLTSIRMYSEMLGDNWVSDEAKKKEYYQNIQQESERLSRLIENVLQMARLEKQSYRLHLKKQNPKEDFLKWKAQFETLASKEGFQFNFKTDENLPEIQYDPEALKEVLLIFLENSVKFSHQASNKNLELQIQAKPSYLELKWKDYGPGVPAKEVRQIFEKFYRVENELTRKTKGTGIGLAIAKMMVEEMGAQIEAKNGEASGLELVIRFPV